MKQRVTTAIVMIVLLVPLVFLGSYFTGILASTLAAIGTYEIVRLHNKKNNLKKVFNYIIPGFSFILCFTTFILGHFNVKNTLVYAICLLITIFMFLCTVCITTPDLRVKDAFFYLATIFYVASGFTILAYMRDHTFFEMTFKLGTYDINLSGLFVVVYILLCALLTDCMALTMGMLFGKHKLAPVVSPKKTVEGFVLGILSSSLIITIFIHLLRYAFSDVVLSSTSTIKFIIFAFILTVILATIAQLGDLVASKLKREYDVKDYGNLFPGHGGVLDRFDSVLPCATFSFVLLFLVGLL